MLWALKTVLIPPVPRVFINRYCPIYFCFFQKEKKYKYFLKIKSSITSTSAKPAIKAFRVMVLILFFLLKISISLALFSASYRSWSSFTTPRQTCASTPLLPWESDAIAGRFQP